MKTNNLIVSVDVQNDFISGSLGSTSAVAVTKRISEFFVEIEKNRVNTKVIGTFDTHERDEYLNTREGKMLPVQHCLSGTTGWESPLIDFYDECISKQDFMSAPSIMESHVSRLVHPLYRKMRPKVFVFGFCTSICVIANALLLRQMLPEADLYLVTDLCGDISTYNHEAGLTVAKANQIMLCTAEEAKAILNETLDKND